MAFSQWLAKSRRGGGEFTTPGLSVPAGVDTARIQLDVTPADFDTPDLAVTATIEASFDGGQTWEFQMSTGWVGQSPPPITRGGVEGWFTAVNGLSELSGALVRVHFSTAGTFRWGLLGELI
jgi:hypothetical protein